MNPNNLTEENEEYLSFWTHLEELRRVLIKVIVIVLGGILIAFCFHQQIISLATSPWKNLSHGNAGNLKEEGLTRIVITNSSTASTHYHLPLEASIIEISPRIKKLTARELLIPVGESLVIEKKVRQELFVFGPVEGISIALKISLWIGLLSTAPLWIFIILQFIYPALQQQEKRLIVPFFSLSFFFIFLGFLFGFYLTIPLANQYLQTFNRGIGTNLWSLSHYLDYTLFLMLSNAVAFELGVVGLFLVHVDVMTEKWLVSQRRLMIVGSFIVGALLTPPDVLTQVLLAGIFILLYEGLILYAKSRALFHKRKAMIPTNHFTRTGIKSFLSRSSR